MSDAEAKPDRLDAIESRLSDLEKRVEALSKKIDATAEESAQGRESGLDHYDEAAIDWLPDDKPFGLSVVKSAYRTAGIRDGSKIKERLKYLTKIGAVEKTGHQHWRVVENE